MKQIIRLTESDLHRLVKESVRRILAENDYDVSQPAFPMMRRKLAIGDPSDEEVEQVDFTGVIDRTGGDNNSLSVNHVNESIIREDWRKKVLGGAMALSSLIPNTVNAQGAQSQQNKQDSIRSSQIQRYYNMNYTKRELMQIFPQAYMDRNANPEVWKKHAREGKYYARVNDNGDGKYRENLVAYMAAKDGENPWDAVVERFCKEDVFQLGDFDI